MPHYDVEVLDHATVVLVSERDEILLRGELMAAVASRLDGQRSADDIATELGATALPADVYYVIGWLEEKGYVIDGTGCMAEAAGFWTSLGVAPREAQRKLTGTALELHRVGVGDLGALTDSLHAWGIEISGSAASLLVVTDDYLHPELDSINRACQAEGRSWMLVRSPSSVVWVGPAFVPGHTGCWTCLSKRLEGNHPLRGPFRRSCGWRRAGAAWPCAPTDARRAAQALQAGQIAQWVVREEEAPVIGRVLTLDLASLHSETHLLVRLPDCPTCRSIPATPAPPTRVELRSRPRTIDARGSRHIASVEQMLDQCQPHVSWLTGAVHNVRERPVPDGSGIRVFTSTYSRVGHVDRPRGRDDAWRSGCAGRGTTAMEARASAIGEAIERFSAQFHGNEDRMRAALNDLGDSAVHPNRCMGFSDQQYEDRGAWNAHGARFRFVPRPFDRQAEIDWTPLWSLTHDEVRYLPTAYCYLFYPQPPEQHWCVGCTNGNASGLTLEDAVLQGLLELVERDAVAIWWYNRVRRPGVDLAAFDHPWLAQNRTFLRQLGREMWVLDLTTDIEIPVFAAISRAVEGPEGISMGFGAHPSPDVALLRAVTEHMQTLSAAVPMDGRPGLRLEAINDPEARHWLTRATVARHAYLSPDDRASPRFTACPGAVLSADVRDEIIACKATLERQGLELIVLAMTRPEIGMPVAKVVVPGLRHFWARFAPGRLYDVPVQLGWLDRPLTEPEFNPVALFL